MYRDCIHTIMLAKRYEVVYCPRSYLLLYKLSRHNNYVGKEQMYASRTPRLLLDFMH
jgi:hypothetical protein